MFCSERLTFEVNFWTAAPNPSFTIAGLLCPRTMVSQILWLTGHATSSIYAWIWRKIFSRFGGKYFPDYCTIWSLQVRIHRHKEFWTKQILWAHMLVETLASKTNLWVICPKICVIHLSPHRLWYVKRRGWKDVFQFIFIVIYNLASFLFHKYAV